jgi:hypothetical protein
MDPLSCLAVVTSVIQVLDFSAKLITSTYAIQKYKAKAKGSEHANNTRTIADRLRRLTGHLNDSLQSSATVVSPSSDHNEDLSRLCVECNEVSDQLVAALDALEAHGNQELWNSFRQALKTFWTQGEIDALQKRLDSLRQQISMYVLVTIR